MIHRIQYHIFILNQYKFIKNFSLKNYNQVKKN